MTTPNSSESLFQFMREIIADTMSKLAPGLDGDRAANGNPVPCAVLAGRDEKLVVIGIDPAYMQNGETKENLVVLLRQAIRAQDAIGICLMCPVWMARTLVAPGEDPEDSRAKLPDSLGDAPGAQEFLFVWNIAPTGSEHWLAPIVRHADLPPQPGPWSKPWRAFVVERDRFTRRLRDALIANAGQSSSSAS